MPPPDPLPDLLSNARAYLIAEGIVRSPRVAGPLPVAWIEPEDGAVAPGDKLGDENHDEAVLSIFRSGGVGLEWIEQRWHRKDTIDVVIRTASNGRAQRATTIEEELRYAFLGSGEGDLKMNWTMGALTVIQSQLWRPLQPLDHSGDPPIYTAICSFLFELYTT